MQLPAFADRAWVRRDPPQLEDHPDPPAGCSHARSSTPPAEPPPEQPPSSRSGSAAASATAPPAAAWRFSVMSYNILCDTYAHYFAQWLYKDVPQHCLPWSYRLPLLVQEMLFWDADVICLQEVSRFEELELALRPGGYRGLFLRRGGRRRDGCAVFWKAQRLALLAAHHVLFSELGLEDNVALVVQLQPLAAGSSDPAAEPGSSGSGSSSSIVVATTHVCFDPNKGDVKLGQVRELIAKVDELLRRSPGAVAVITGDFNLVPCCPIYDFISSGQLDFGELSKRRLSGQVKGFGHQQFFQALQSSADAGPHARAPQQPASSELQLWSQLPALSVPRPSQPRCSGSGCAPAAGPGAGDQSPSSVPSGGSTPQAPPTAAPSASPGPADPAQPGLPILCREPGSAAGVSGFLAASQQEPQFERPSAPPPPGGHVHRSWSVKAARAALGADGLECLLQRQQQMDGAGSMDQALPPPGPPPLAAGPKCVALDAEPGTQALVLAAACPPAEPDATKAPGQAQPQPQPPSADDAGGGEGERTSGSGMRMRRASSAKGKEPGREGVGGALKGSLVARHPLHLVSSYHALQGEEPMFTSVHSGFIGTCDYIWYTPEASSASNASRPEPGSDGGPPQHPRDGAGAEGEARGAECAERNGGSCQPARLIPLAVLAPPRIQLLEGGLPAPSWGSDHVSILCEFALQECTPPGS